MKIEMKLLFLALMVLFVGCSNDAVSGHEVVPIAGDISSSAVTQSSSSREVVERSCSSSEESCSSAEEMASSSSDILSSSSESVESSSSLEEQELSSSSSSFEGKSSSSSLVVIYGEMTDERDGQKYRTVYIEKIGRTWMIQNLNYAYLQPTAELDSSSWCFDFGFGDEVEIGCEKYGRLYLWSAAVDSAALFSDTMKGCGYYESLENWQKCPLEKNVRGVCPDGWRLPTYDDYVDLMSWRVFDLAPDFKEDQLGNYAKLKNSYVATSNFWLVTEKDFAHGIRDDFCANSLEYSEGGSIIDLKVVEKKQFHAVRCVRDKEIEE